MRENTGQLGWQVHEETTLVGRCRDKTIYLQIRQGGLGFLHIVNPNLIRYCPVHRALRDTHDSISHAFNPK